MPLKTSYVPPGGGGAYPKLGTADLNQRLLLNVFFNPKWPNYDYDSTLVSKEKSEKNLDIQLQRKSFLITSELALFFKVPFCK